MTPIAWICAWFSLSFCTCLGNRLVLFFITIYLTFSIFMSITLSPHDFSFFWRTTNIRNKSARWKTFSYIKWAFSGTRLQNGLYLALMLFALVADVLELSKLSTENKPSNECVISQSTLVLQLSKLLALQGQLVNPSTLLLNINLWSHKKSQQAPLEVCRHFTSNNDLHRLPTSWDEILSTFLKHAS